ncbi:MAG: hypothetical protein K2N04_02585, partial [Alistipes sp.]|nr:hypothetical protein [Alistipes sp.]
YPRLFGKIRATIPLATATGATGAPAMSPDELRHAPTAVFSRPVMATDCSGTFPATTGCTESRTDRTNSASRMLALFFDFAIPAA